MATRQDSSGRMQPTEGRYLAEPGYCAICMKTPDNMEEVFANPSIELDQYGCIYLCQNCCAEVGSFVLMRPDKEYQSLLDVVEGMQRRIDQLTNQNAYVRGLLNARIDLAGTSESVGDGVASVLVSETEQDSVDIDSIIDGLEPNAD